MSHTNSVLIPAPGNLYRLASKFCSLGSHKFLHASLGELVTTVFRCALQLMKDNAGEFLRRISIICLEDAILHPDMPLLVWLMCAQAKGYTIGAAAAAACLQIVYQLACMPVRDHYPVHPAELSTGRFLHILYLHSCPRCDVHCIPMHRCLMLYRCGPVLMRGSECTFTLLSP